MPVCPCARDLAVHLFGINPAFSTPGILDVSTFCRHPESMVTLNLCSVCFACYRPFLPTQQRRSSISRSGHPSTGARRHETSVNFGMKLSGFTPAEGVHLPSWRHAHPSRGGGGRRADQGTPKPRFVDANYLKTSLEGFTIADGPIQDEVLHQFHLVCLRACVALRCVRHV